MVTVNIAIIGATGHTGEELIDILLRHPQAKITGLYNRGENPVAISEVFPKFKNRIDSLCKKPDINEIAQTSDLVFLALPHTVSMEFVPRLLKARKRVIDFSADYRFKDAGLYEKSYNAVHKDRLHLKDAVYGLPEIYRADIMRANLLSNPGCYSTCAILGLAPLVSVGLADIESIIIDAKSSVSGAGRKLIKEFLFSEIDENFSAYKVNTHRHIPEINHVLSKLGGRKTNVTFVPHLLPLKRGILATIYSKKAKNTPARVKNLIQLYEKFYKNEPFMRIRKENQFPQIKDVAGTNFCDIGIKEEDGSVIIIAAIDNLLKGASGQAVQNMNIMYNLPERLGLL